MLLPNKTSHMPINSRQNTVPQSPTPAEAMSKQPLATMSTTLVAVEHSPSVLSQSISSQPLQTMNAGSCALRLENLEYLSPTAKGELMHSLAEDISATFICIGKHIEAGTLNRKQTRVIDNVIKTIQDTDVEHCMFLERKVLRLRRERHFLRKRHGIVAGQADTLARRWKHLALEKAQLLKEARGEIVRLRGDGDILWECVKKGHSHGNGDINGADGVGGNGELEDKGASDGKMK